MLNLPIAAKYVRLVLGILFMILLPILVFLVEKCFQTLVQIEFGRNRHIKIKRLVGIPQGSSTLLDTMWRLRTLPAGCRWTVVFLLMFYFGLAAHLVITSTVVNVPLHGK